MGLDDSPQLNPSRGPRLQDRLAELTCGDDARAEAAATSLAGLALESTGQALEQLSVLYSSPEADTRWWATRALAEIPDAGACQMLAQALGDSDGSVRQCAALGLRQRADADTTLLLINALADEDHLVASLAADALGAIGAPAVPFLLEIMARGARTVRLRAVRALALIGDKRSIPALFSALDEDSALMEYWAAEGLERMGVGMAFFMPE